MATTNTQAVHYDQQQRQPQTASGGTAAVFTRPSPVRPAPVKHLKTPPTVGKRLSMDRSTYDAPEDRSSAEEERIVDSPVSGVVHEDRRHGDKRKKKARSTKRTPRSSSSSSCSSTDSRADRSSPPPVVRKKHQKAHCREEESGGERRRRKSETPSGRSEQPRSSRSRSGERERSRTTDGDKTPARKGPRIRNDPATAAPRSHRPKTTAVVTNDAALDSVPVEDPPECIVERNHRVYQTITNQRNASLPLRDAGEADAASCAASSVVSRAPSVRINKRNNSAKRLSVTYLQACLCEDLRTNAFALQSVQLLWTTLNSSQVKQKQVIDMVRSMYYVPSSSDDFEPRLNNNKYLFCPFNDTYGYDQEMLKRNAKNADRSLASALKFNCDPNEHSLDIVFRRVLKEIADEMYTLDRRHNEVTLDNPVYISGQYLELRLLEKIRRYYKAHLNGKDIADYLTKCSVDTDSPFHGLVNKTAAEEYVRTLYDRYRLRPETFDEVLKNISFAPPKMRVWTEVSTQVRVNATLTDFLKKVLYDGDKRYSIYQNGMEIIEEYATEMKAFVDANRDFLAEVCRASELFAWMCLGIVTDHHEDGTMYMSTFYHILKREQAAGAKSSNVVYWNYPLASMCDRELPAVVFPLCNTNKLLKRKWRSLRDSYGRELKLQTRTNPGTGKLTRKQYVYFSKLSFLRTLTGKCKLDNRSNNSDEDNINEESDSDMLHWLDNSENQGNNEEPECGSVTQPSLTSRKRRISDNLQTEIEDQDGTTQLTQTVVDVSASALTCDMEQDPDRLFLLSLLSDIKKVHEDDRLELKSELILVVNKWKKKKKNKRQI